MVATLTLWSPIAMAAPADWPTYHRDYTRAGNDTSSPTFSGVSPQWTSIHLDNNAWSEGINAEPLVVGSRVIVATVANTVYSLDASTGAVQWSTNVGTPARNADVGCGLQDPVGMQATPVVDTANGIVYAVALVKAGSTLQYYMVGLDIITGTRKFSDLPITVAGLDPFYQGQRGALALSATAGKVYIPFGGRDGDCNPYHGFVVAAPASGSGGLTVFNDHATIPPSFRQPVAGAGHAGFWASAGPAIDAAGNIYVTAGDGGDGGNWDYGNVVFRLNSSLQMQDYFAPSDWVTLNQQDRDLGSTGPAIVGPNSDMIFQIGKSGVGYLLSMANLSANSTHIGGELFSAAVCDMSFGGVAYANGFIYVGCLDGLHALQLNGASFTEPWNDLTTRYGPPIVSGGIVWALQINNGILDGFDAATGVKKFTFSVGPLTHFMTPTASAGRIFVATGNEVRAFGQAAGPYHALPPTRILDTRDGNGGFNSPLGPSQTITLQVTGRGGVPTSGVSAVVLNVTVANTARPGWLTVYPTDTPLPLASNLNWAQGQIVPNLVETVLGSNGRIEIHNGSDGPANVIADVEGYVATPSGTSGPDGLYNPINPSRVLDTRSAPLPLGQATPAPVGPGQTITVQVTGLGGVPAATDVGAVVLNVTAANPTALSYLTVFPSGNLPNASNLNFVARQVIPNRVITPVDSNGRVKIFNGAGSVNVIVDVGGWFTSSTSTLGGSQYTALPPSRILDTRVGTGGFSSPLGPGQRDAVTVAGVGGVPPMGAPNAPKAVVLNVTATGATSFSYLTVWPTPGVTPPNASDLNFPPNSNNPNLVVVKVGPDGKVNIYNGFGSVNVVADIEGWYS
ncbi:MAG: PQQ-binding-like beta-propeller repeat protein [Candidatus Dormibacteraeota bacterium]|nr:PQQ-binding-like beta-propeller repeat protein [Candidatus Dormibacteraeota bacterium]